MANPRLRVRRTADWNHIKGTHSRSQLVNDVVARSYQGFGLVCEVGGKRYPALIRNREISWDPTKQRADTVPLNQPFTAIVLGYDEEWRELILSLKGAEPVPFSRFTQTHKIGDVLDATVIKAVPGGYILSTEGDVEAFLPHAEVPMVCQIGRDQIEEADSLLTNDEIFVVLKEIDLSDSKLTVSLMEYVNRLRSSTITKINELKDDAAQQSAEPSAIPNVPNCVPRSAHPLIVLLVEDKTALSSQLAAALQVRGHTVVIAESEADAERLSRQLNAFDVVLLDLQLKNGLVTKSDWLATFRSNQGTVNIYLFTANPEIMFAKSDNRLTPYINGLIRKPLDTDKIIAIIEGTIPAEPLVLPSVPEPLESRAKGSVAFPASVQDYLKAAQAVCGECKPTLLAYDGESQEVTVVHSLGLDAQLVNMNRKKLVRSPLGEALADHHQINERISRHSDDSLGDLLRSAGCDTVIGFPLHLDSYRQTLGLFVFCRYSYMHASSEIERRLGMIAEELALAIEKSWLHDEVLRQQRATCVGGLLVGMAHELRNCVQTLENFRYNIAHALPAVLQGQTISTNILNEAVSGMKTEIESLRTDLEMFLGIARVKESEKRPLNDILSETVNACRNSARQWDVLIHLTCESGICYPEVPYILRQCFMNLILNAIQHCSYAPVGRGLVDLSVRQTCNLGTPCIEIRVRDNGLGIHTCHRKHLFQMFFTTRMMGTGLGLYVSKIILQSIGASIELEDSRRFGGTTFCIRIPIAANTEEVNP
jgi:signal transduction histidine kinase/ActR/RegA family two-component response regulator